MIYCVSGTVRAKGDDFIAVETAGVGYKCFTHAKLVGAARLGEQMSLFTHLHVREGIMDLYGFSSPAELEFFELLISVSGVGPKSALSILEIATLQNLASAIKENRADLLTKASGIGRKTAERIVLELQNKVRAEFSEATVEKMESDVDILETLVNLGYRRDQAKTALDKVHHEVVGLEGRLKEALKFLTGRK